MDLFVTRVSDYIISDIDTLRFDIINHILNEESSAEPHKSYSMRGKTGYHSHDDLCNREESWSKDLKLLLHRMIQDHAVHSNRPVPPPNIARINCWAMIMRKGDFSSFHNHPSALFSGVLYLDVPEQLDKKEGQLVFVDPRSQTRVGRYYDHDVFKRITPKIGHGYVFPNWLDHFVDPHYCEGNRISLSFNLCDM
mgnify:CR=1 FL=1